MFYDNAPSDPAKVLDWVSTAWLILTGGFLLVGYGGVVVTAESFSVGMKNLLTVFQTMSMSSIVSLVIILGPGIAGKILARRLRQKRTTNATHID